MRAVYVRIMQGSASLLRRQGLLPRLERSSRGRKRSTWFVSLLAIYDLDAMIRLDVPWWTLRSSRAVADFLESRSAARVFEWGSGASTVWLAKRAQHVTSVEHDARWLKSLRPVVAANVSLTYAPATPATDDTAVRSGRRGYEGLDFSAYVQAIEIAGGPFDLIVIDGRARVSCLRAAARQLAPGGLIVFDNAGRRRYRRALADAASDLDKESLRGLTPGLPYLSSTVVLRAPSE